MNYFDCSLSNGGGGGGGGGTGSYLLVNCSSAFAGLNINCSKGASVITEVCPNVAPYEVGFNLTEGGNWTISAIIDDETYSTEIFIGDNAELKAYNISDGTTVPELNDVQIWLKCANIRDKDYTTIQEVIADEDTLWSLVSDSNSVNYLVRCADWISTMVSSPKAMKIMSLSDYCCDVLCTNITWSTAICNSQYYKILLRDSVPFMTSVNAPKGEIIYSNTVETANTYGALYPFWVERDRRAYCWRTGVRRDSGDSGQWLGYMFVRNTLVKMVEIMLTSTATTATVKVQASDNGTEWTDLTEDTSVTGNGVLNTIPIINNTHYYKFYRVFQSYISSTYFGEIRWLDFYGIENTHDSDIIYSAPYDTIYYLDDGNPVTVCTTGSDGKGEVDWSELDNSNITFYSTVAKNIDNPSLPYSKTFRNTPNKKVDYLMPLSYFYWYGTLSDQYSDAYTFNSQKAGSSSSGSVSASISVNTNYIQIDMSDGSSATGLCGTEKIESVEVTDYSEYNAFIELASITGASLNVYEYVRLSLLPSKFISVDYTASSGGESNPTTTITNKKNPSSVGLPEKYSLDISSTYGFKWPAILIGTNATIIYKIYAFWME